MTEQYHERFLFAISNSSLCHHEMSVTVLTTLIIYAVSAASPRFLHSLHLIYLIANSTDTSTCAFAPCNVYRVIWGGALFGIEHGLEHRHRRDDFKCVERTQFTVTIRSEEEAY